MKLKIKNIHPVQFIIIILVSCTIFACQKDAPLNPFDDPSLRPPVDTSSQETLIDPTSLTGLHKNIFKPTCANSGCHDGTFEPDFRTIESTYNTMVNKTAISPYSEQGITVRVVPNNVGKSMLYYRLTEFLPQSSGIMPLEANESDWQTKKDEHLSNIKAWIEKGAPNVFDE